MKTNFYITIILLIISKCYSQSYKITYSLNFIENSLQLKDENFGKYYQYALIGAKSIKFELSCNDSISKFQMIDFLYSDNQEVKWAVTLSSAKAKYFKISNSIYKTEIHQIFEKKYIIKDSLLTNWEITNETKKINNYTCYKATAKYKIINPKGVFYHPVIAWFCPEIPLQHGPRGFGGLPGLILELQYREIVFGATLIEKTNEPVIFNFEEEIIDQSEYDKKLLELRKN